MTQDKVPQNVQDLISEIGERMVLFKAFELTHSNKNLEIFKNYSDIGYDIGIRNVLTGKKVKIEVKTRQHLVTTTAEQSKNSCHFTATENEKMCADFLVGYWLEFHDFFIVPIDELTETKTKDKRVYKHVVSRLKNPKSDKNLYSDKSMEYLNNWSKILDFIA